MKRNRVVNENMLTDKQKLVKLVNSAKGPIVTWDRDRKCYGLKADRDYKAKRVVTK